MWPSFFRVPPRVERALVVNDPQEFDSDDPPNPSRQLALRFAAMLTRRQQLHSINRMHARRRKPRTIRSKNCKTTQQKRNALGFSTRQMQKLRLDKDDDDELTAISSSTGSSLDDECELQNDIEEPETQQELEETLARLQTRLIELERTACLQESALLMWRHNRTAMAVDLCKEFHVIFKNGYEPNNTQYIDQTLATQSFMDSVFDEAFMNRDFQGKHFFLDQWEKYTLFHRDFSVRLCSIVFVDEQDTRVSVRTVSEIQFIVTVDTLKFLYPAFYQQMLTDPAACAIADKLLDQRVTMEFDMVLHFNEHARIFAQESRMHAIAGLLKVIRDPSETMRVFNMSLMTTSGHWKVHEDICTQQRAAMLPTPML